MSSAAIAVTKQNIAVREAKAARLRSILTRLPRKDKRRFALMKALQNLGHELAALKASLHFYKPKSQLSAEMIVQQRRIDALRSKVGRTVTGSAREAYIKQLEAELARLKGMVAAAHLQAREVPPAPLTAPAPDLALVTPAGESEEDAAIAVEESTPAPAMDFDLPELPSLPGSSAFDFSADDEAAGDEWYKHPLVLIGAGAAIVLLLRR